ncbi:MAG: rhomboid family intramembrane serine protease [Bacteroidota bacterium]
MFSEILSSRQVRAWQVYSLTLCCALVTVASISWPNLQYVFGSYGDETTKIQRLTLTFQHGFDGFPVSGFVHLLINLLLFIFLGLATEKILGTFYFFILTACAMIFYMVVHSAFNMTGHGAGGVLYAYAPVIFYSLSEGRLLKTRSVFDEMYRNLRTVLLIMYTVIPILMAVVPIHFDSDIPFYQAFLYGNIFHISATLLGIIFMFLFKEPVRQRLKHFAKKKKFASEPTDKYELWLAMTYPALIVIAFILSR